MPMTFEVVVGRSAGAVRGGAAATAGAGGGRFGQAAPMHSMLAPSNVMVPNALLSMT